MRDLWSAEIAKTDGITAQVDALLWLGRTTLDMIGLAGELCHSDVSVTDLQGEGFNYHFEALNPSGQVNELNQAFNTLFSPESAFQLFGFLQGIFPPLRLIVCFPQWFLCAYNGNLSC